jgi:Glycosyltransferase like family
LNLELVSATRVSSERFLSETALGASLKRLAWDTRIKNYVFFDNSRPLGDVYNQTIDARQEDSYLLFVHDDVWLDDFNLYERISEALGRFDVVGVAGNTRVAETHCSWAFVDDRFTWDVASNLSGRVAHGKTPFGLVSHFGETPKQCALLDGVLLAARRSVLNRHSVRFDPQFAFHFYDLDFCRSALQAGLTLGTWPIGLTHQSGGNFGAENWRQKLMQYRKKWAAKDATLPLSGRRDE